MSKSSIPAYVQPPQSEDTSGGDSDNYIPIGIVLFPLVAVIFIVGFITGMKYAIQ